MLNPMVLNAGQKIYLVSIGGYHFGDGVWAEMPIVEFLTWSMGSNIAGIKPYIVSKFKC